MRLFIIDTLSTVVFFTIVATFSELVIAGMNPAEVLTTRLVMVPIMIVTGRPYTGWRDWLHRQIRPNRRSGAALTDIAAFVSSQVPVYGATLILAGASLQQAAVAILSAIVFMILLARPFGLFVDRVRQLFGIVLP
ncbi:L-alanine exporter AlaE [Pararhodobacter sp. SW119]|uniref:L-alanine exporter AlaE n=1 Tax=Pararhodobacter sp. SW119 TaxID=2780075 RepID=UPI001ADEFDDD|nr:L-alanine exporter AlaE [Pararhodobacter sp. SW119]